VADAFGRRRLLVAGLALFAVASLASGLAQSPLMLILGRVVQGAAGAMVSPAALSLLTTMNAEGPARNRALGIWQATTAAGATTGIIAGGLLTQYLGWRAVFLVNLPLIAAMLVVIPRLLPASASEGGARVDVRGAVLVSSALAALIFGLGNGQQHGFTSSVTVVALAGAVLLAAGFVVTELKVSAPMLPLAIFASPARRAAVGAMLLMGGIVAAYVYFTSLYLQNVRNFSPVLTGLALIPATATVVLTSTFGAGRLLTRFGAKRMLLAGLGSIAAGQLWLAQISAESSYAAVVLPGLLLTAFGMGLAFPTVSVVVTTGIQRRDQGIAGALFAASQQIGAAAGLAVLATVAAERTEHAGGSLIAGYHLSFLVATGIAVAAAALVAAQLRPTSTTATPTRSDKPAPTP
jgi:MFS family permease